MKRIYYYIIYFLPALASAQDCDGLICNPIGHLKTSAGRPVETFIDVIDVVLSIMIQIVIPVTAILIIMTGFKFATAQGDPGKIKKARESLTYILIGLAILLLSKGIQLGIQETIESLK